MWFDEFHRKQLRPATTMRKDYVMEKAHLGRFGARALGLALAVTLGGSGLLSASASASTLGGTATIADPSTSQPLASGGSTTQFTVTLPAQAACSGDTATGHYHVYSYLVPKGTDITTLTFPSGHPSTGWGLFTSGGTYYGSQNTAQTTGQIINIPTNFEWQPVNAAAGGITGVWEAGIACADTNNNLSDYWNTEVTFTTNASDPNGFTWAAVPGVPSQTPELGWAVLLPVSAVGILGLGIWARSRRSTRLAPATEVPET